MCEFCIQHGEGKKWYLNMRNYSRELFEEQHRRKFAEDFTVNMDVKYSTKITHVDIAGGWPIIGRFARYYAFRKFRSDHWGQAIPIEDLEQVVDMQSSIVRLPCICRKLTTGREYRYCFGIGIDIDHHGILGKYPDFLEGLEVMSKEETKEILRKFDKQGLVHSIWTFKAPFIGAICNCDQDCMGFRIQMNNNLPSIMFRGEYVASVDWELCSGCKKCLQNCQFGAISYSYITKRATIDMRKCYGCGVCRAVCDKEAIILKSRTEFAGLPW